MYSLPPLSGRLILKLRLKLELWPEPRLILSSFLPPPSLRSPPTNKPVQWRHLVFNGHSTERSPLFHRVNMEGWDAHSSTLHPLFLIHTAWDWDWYRERDWHNRKQWVLDSVSMSDQCEHLYIVLNSPFGPCTSPGPGPMQCKYTITLSGSHFPFITAKNTTIETGGGGSLWRLSRDNTKHGVS